MDIWQALSLAVGVLGTVVAAATLYRTRKVETMVRVKLAMLAGHTDRIRESAGWACSHFNTVRECFDAENWADRKVEASKSLQLGCADSTSGDSWSPSLENPTAACTTEPP